MRPAVRAALDRLMYEQAVTLHMLELVPGALQRPLGDGQTVGHLLAGVLERERALAAWLRAGATEPLDPPPPGVSPRAQVEPAELMAALREALRAVVTAATELPVGALEGDRLAELWGAAAMFTAAREALRAALPEALNDPVVARWWKAPEPPDSPASPGGGEVDAVFALGAATMKEGDHAR